MFLRAPLWLSTGLTVSIVTRGQGASLDLCHIIGLRPLFSALRALTWPSASISACSLNFRPFWPHLGLWFRYTVLHAAYYYAAALSLAIKMLMMRHHGDDVYMTSQPIAVQTDAIHPSTFNT